MFLLRTGGCYHGGVIWQVSVKQVSSYVIQEKKMEFGSKSKKKNGVRIESAKRG